MRLTINLKPEQLFTEYLTSGDVVEVVRVIVSKYRDETLLWDVLQTVLETIIADYKDEQEWYVQRQVEFTFSGEGEYAVDPEVIAEAEKYTRAAEKIKSMIALLREGKVDDVIGN